MIFGCVYEGNFSKNTRKGQGKMTYSTGEVYEGEWIDDVQSTFFPPPPLSSFLNVQGLKISIVRWYGHDDLPHW